MRMETRDREGWLPDFCRAPMLFAAMLIGECVVVIAWLLPSPGTFDFPGFFMASAYAQWLTLLCAGALCFLHRPFNRLPVAIGALLALLAIALICVIAALAVRRLDSALGLALTGAASDFRFVAASAGLAVIFSALTLRYLHMQERWRAAVSDEASARFDALQARIHPHFLFNTLNTASGLIRSQPKTAEAALLDLSDLLRAALAREGGRNSLSDELDLARRYLAIEQLRLGDRLHVDWRIDDSLPLELRLPVLTLQPLVENAVLHGVAPLPEGGTVSLHARREGEIVRIDIRNPLAGERADVAALTLVGRTQGNIRDRLRLALGIHAGLSFETGDGHYLTRLSLPFPASAHHAT